MKQLSRLFAMSLFSVLAMVILTACGPASEVDNEESVDADKDATIKVGAIMPLTGDGAAYGVPMQKVAEIALAEVNEAGGVDGMKVEFVWEDGKCNGKDAVNAAQKLINVDKVEIIYGGFCSSETLGIAPVAEEAGVVVFSPGSSSPDITSAGDYIFRNYPSDSSQGAIVAKAMSDLGLKKIGILSEQNDYTLGIATVLEEKFVESEGEVVTDTFLATDTDFRTQITKMKGEGIEAIFINPQTPAKADIILKQLQEQDLGVSLFGNDVVLGWTEGLERYKDFVEGMIGAEASYRADDPSFVSLVEQYKAETGDSEIPFATYSATTYDGVYILAEGLSEVGNEADAFRDYLYGISGREGTAGSLTIDENGDPESGHVLKVVEGAKTLRFQ